MQSLDSAQVVPRDLGAEWMVAWQNGEDGAFERLVEAYSGRVYALLTRFLGRHPAREDLVQETFLRVVRARDRYQPTARFTTWLYRIVFNLAVNETQRSSATAELALDASFPETGSDPARHTDPAAGLEREDAVVAVRRAIAELPEQQRMALVLAKYEELPYAEIGNVLGCSEKAIKSLVHRARERLRERLAHFLTEERA